VAERKEGGGRRDETSQSTVSSNKELENEAVEII